MPQIASLNGTSALLTCSHFHMPDSQLNISIQPAARRIRDPPMTSSEAMDGVQPCSILSEGSAFRQSTNLGLPLCQPIFESGTAMRLFRGPGPRRKCNAVACEQQND